MNDSPKEKGSSITRVLEIFEAVARAERPLSPADLSLQLAIPKPSIHRLLAQLESEKYIQYDLRGRLFPGERMHDNAISTIYNSQYKAPRQAILGKLAHTIGETCGIARPNGTNMIYFDRVETNWPLQINLPIGSNTPLNCTASGKLYLSTLPSKHLQPLIENLQFERYTPNTLTEIGALENEIVSTKKINLGLDNEEFIQGMVACAVPILDRNKKLFACLFTHAPTIRKTIEELKAFEPQMRETASALEKMINRQ
ncbi:MAG: IclR family acetate operon transcriptional repressor [Flavobacteriales bacterium]|jgi:IclR family acetate operon transcriptional repressor